MKKKIRHKNAAVYIFNKELKAILVHQRAGRRKKFPYTILTPGGKKEKVDKNISDTAIREIKEETGIELKKDELIEIGSTNTTKYFLVYFNPKFHQVSDCICTGEILKWTLTDVGIDSGDGKNRWLSWSDLVECKQGPKMHLTDPRENLGYLHPALLNKFQGGVWNLRRQGIFNTDVKCLTKKFYKVELELYVNYKTNIFTKKKN